MNWWKEAYIRKISSEDVSPEHLADLGRKGNEAAAAVEEAIKKVHELKERMKAIAGDVRAKEKAGGKPFAKATAKLEDAKTEIYEAERSVETLRDIALRHKEAADMAWRAAPLEAQRQAMILIFGTDKPYWYED